MCVHMLNNVHSLSIFMFVSPWALIASFIVFDLKKKHKIFCDINVYNISKSI